MFISSHSLYSYTSVVTTRARIVTEGMRALFIIVVYLCTALGKCDIRDEQSFMNIFFTTELIKINDAALLTCPPVFCLSKPLSSCSCVATHGPLLEWMVYTSNGSESGVISHFIGQINYNTSVQYPLVDNPRFVSVLTNNTVGNISSTLYFTPNKNMTDYLIQCYTNDSSAATKNIQINGKIV